jgi:ADP-ribose pyrophosphatase
LAVEDGRGPAPEPTEFIRVVEVPFGEALAMVRDGRITDAATALGLLWEEGRGGGAGRQVD